MKRFTRREFILTGTAAGTVLTAAGCTTRNISQTASASGIKYRPLGTTGYQVSEIGLGAMNTRDPELISAAIDAGINYIDTGHGYMNGANEEIIGTVMTSKRDRVFLTTKFRAGADQIEGMLETSLKRLRTDYVDCAMYHGPTSREQMLDPEYIEVFGRIRDKGQARFVGFSTHSNMPEVLAGAVDSKFWQIAMVSYNFSSPQEMTDAIEKARKAGIGIVAMKTLAKGAGNPDRATATVTPNQAALRWVLNNNNVDTTVPGMTSFEHIAEDLAAMGISLASGDYRDLADKREKIQGSSCMGIAGCTGCLNKCPFGVQVHEINRCLGYAQGYGDIRLARENYAALPVSSRIDACSHCDECQVKCVNGLNITGNIRKARTLFC